MICENGNLLFGLKNELQNFKPYFSSGPFGHG